MNNNISERIYQKFNSKSDILDETEEDNYSCISESTNKEYLITPFYISNADYL